MNLSGSVYVQCTSMSFVYPRQLNIRLSLQCGYSRPSTVLTRCILTSHNIKISPKVRIS